MKAFVIGLAGGSASGKTTVARRVIESLGVPWVCLLSMDSFYKALTPEQHEMAAVNEYNFDIPGEPLCVCACVCVHVCMYVYMYVCVCRSFLKVASSLLSFVHE